jgi:hypothetical protein
MALTNGGLVGHVSIRLQFQQLCWGKARVDLGCHLQPRDP